MMKLKPNQTRTYDGDGFKKRAACLCFKNEREEEVRLSQCDAVFLHLINNMQRLCAVTLWPNQSASSSHSKCTGMLFFKTHNDP